VACRAFSRIRTISLLQKAMDNLPPDYRFVLFISQHYYRSGSIILTIKCDAVVVSNGSLISANDTTPVRDDATALAMIKPRKHR